MTRRGQKELSDQERQQLAQLMRLHLETHPARVGRLFGVTSQYVRQLWRQHLTCEMASNQQALGALKERLVQSTVPLYGINAVSPEHS